MFPETFLDGLHNKKIVIFVASFLLLNQKYLIKKMFHSLSSK